METATNKMLPLISAAALLSKINAPELVIVDAQSGKDAFERYAAQHIKGALHVDLDKDLAQKPVNAANGGRHPLPALQQFAKLLGTLGITPASYVVVYDDKSGSNAAARFWWMLRAVGHTTIQVLDGGLKAAIEAGVPITNEITETVTVADYPVNDWQLPTVDLDEVTNATHDAGFLIIDVREAYRYLGESEPIDLIAGHIPNAVNVPYLENLSPDGKFLPAEKLQAIYKSVIGDHDPNKVIVHCGSGVTGCHTLLALEQAGISGTNLYVGSWSEWSRNDLPVANEKD